MRKQPHNIWDSLEEDHPDYPIVIRLLQGEEPLDIARALGVNTAEIWFRIDRNPRLRSALARMQADRVQSLATSKLKFAKHALCVLYSLMSKTEDEKLKARIAQFLADSMSATGIELVLLNRANDLDARILEVLGESVPPESRKLVLESITEEKRVESGE